jgi:hypothetical protein
MLRCMDDVLHTVQDHRPRCADVQEAFDPQNIFAVGVE